MAAKCSMCRQKLDPDEIYHPKNSPKILCEDCISLNFYQCDRCNEYVTEKELAEYDIPDCYDDICLECAKKHLKQCEDCENFILPEHAVIIDNKTYCKDCSETYLYQCDCCKKYVADDELAEYDIPDCYDDICLECAKKYLKQCVDCGNFILPETAVTDGQKIYCPDCAELYQNNCNICNRPFFTKDLRIEEVAGKDIYICQACFQEKIFTCSRCKQYYHADQAVTDEKGNRYCRYCGWQFAPVECFHCQAEILGKDALIVRTPEKDITVCRLCAEKYYRRCYGCRLLKPIAEVTKVKHVWSCKECRKDVERKLLAQAYAWVSDILHGLFIRNIIYNMFRGRF